MIKELMLIMGLLSPIKKELNNNEINNIDYYTIAYGSNVNIGLIDYTKNNIEYKHLVNLDYEFTIEVNSETSQLLGYELLTTINITNNINENFTNLDIIHYDYYENDYTYDDYIFIKNIDTIQLQFNTFDFNNYLLLETEICINSIINEEWYEHNTYTYNNKSTFNEFNNNYNYHHLINTPIITISEIDDIYKNSYNLGHHEGNYIGYNDGYDDGYSKGNENGYANGLYEGYMTGYDDGYEIGNETGFQQGNNVGYNNGFTNGTNEGYTLGVMDGYNTGFTDGEKQGLKGYEPNLFSLFKTTFGAIGSVLTIKLFPGWTLGLLISLPLIVLIIIAILKMVK